MQERIDNIEKELHSIQERNVKVEVDKAWETSWFRILSVAIITYAIASAALFVIGNQNPLRNALIPTIGYLLSVQSLPFLKRRWTDSYLSRHSR